MHPAPVKNSHYLHFYLLFILNSLFFPCTSFALCEDKFCVGLVLPMSGPVAEYGIAIRNGVEMAREDQPLRFKNLTFLYEDSEYQTKKAIASFTKLSRIDKANLIYTWGGSVSEVVAPLGQQLKLATLISSIDPTAKIGRSFVLRFSNPAKDFGQVLAPRLKALKAKRIGIVLTENHYLNSLVNGLKESLDPDQKLVIFEKFSPGDLDFRSTVTKLHLNSFDAIGVFLLPGQVSKFHRELQSQGLTTTTFGSDVFEGHAEIESAGERMNGSFFANHSVSDSFRTRYTKKIGNDYQIAYAGQGYDLANLIGDLFGTTGATATPEEILVKLRNVKEREGVTGQFRFVKTAAGDEYYSFPIVLREIVNNKVINFGQREPLSHGPL